MTSNIQVHVEVPWWRPPKTASNCPLTFFP